MKAVTFTKYGSPDVLQFKEVAKPIPADDEILLQVCATTVNRTDYATIGGIPFFARLLTGLLQPRRQIPGTEFAGRIEAVGKNVSSLKVGDKAFGFDDMGSGAHAEYLTITEDKALSIPEGMSYEQASASMEGAHYAYNFINKVDIRHGKSVLVNGATGAIGSAAVQLLKHFGATVTAVCGTENIELVQSLGADRVIDYKTSDFTRDDQQYDYVFDCVGKSSFFKCIRILRPGGVYISSDLGYLAQNIFLPLITPLIRPLFGYKKTASPIPVNINGTLQLIRKLMKEGNFKAVIDRRYPLEQIVDAYRYVGTGSKIGNVVITVAAHPPHSPTHE